MIVGPNHFTVIAEDLQATLEWYGEVLELHPGPRPDFGFAGAWLYAGGQPVLHLHGDRAPPAQRAGVIDHMAFTATGLAAVKARFDARGWPYELRRQAGGRTWQLFCHDPNGAKLELDFDGAESPD